MTHIVIDDPHDEAARRACRYFLAVSELRLGYFEAVTTWAWIVENARDRIPRKVFDFELVVVVDHKGGGVRSGDGAKRERVSCSKKLDGTHTRTVRVNMSHEAIRHPRLQRVT